MLDEANDRLIVTVLKQSLETVLPLGERPLSQIVRAVEQEIEGEEDQVFGPAFGESRLERGEIRRAIVVERHDLPIDNSVRKGGRSLSDGAEFCHPV
jgi:hypothetical protein